MKKVLIAFFLVILIGAIIAAVYWFLNFGPDLFPAEDTDAISFEAASTGNISDIIGGTGYVRSKQTITLIWQTSGIVENVLVNNHDHVFAGQVLASLDGDSLSQNMIETQANLINLQQQIDDLNNKAALNYADAQLALINAQNKLDELTHDRQWLNYPRCDQDTIEDYWNEYQDRLSEVADLETVYYDSRDSMILSMLTDTRQSRDTAYANYSYCSSPRTENEIAKADTEIAQAQANLEMAQQKLNAMTPDSPDPADVAELQLKIEAEETILDMVELKSPISGTMSAISIQPGDQVTSGTTAFRIDDLSRLFVDVKISEVDINRVAIGQEAVFTLDAASGKEYHGMVSEIATAGTYNQGVVEFNVTITITDSADKDIKPGMTAVVNITVSQLENILLVPNEAVRMLNGERVVYIQDADGGLQAVPVTLGVSSDSYSQVIDGGLRAGDMIAINPPEDLNSTQSDESYSDF
jgi:HlyD family secretion protein